MWWERTVKQLPSSTNPEHSLIRIAAAAVHTERTRSLLMMAAANVWTCPTAMKDRAWMTVSLSFPAHPGEEEEEEGRGMSVSSTFQTVPRYRYHDILRYIKILAYTESWNIIL
jgi:hypothetical protein